MAPLFTVKTPPTVRVPLTSPVPFISIAVAVKSISEPPTILNIEPLPDIYSPPSSWKYSLLPDPLISAFVVDISNTQAVSLSPSVIATNVVPFKPPFGRDNNCS